MSWATAVSTEQHVVCQPTLASLAAGILIPDLGSWDQGGEELKAEEEDAPTSVSLKLERL